MEASIYMDRAPRHEATEKAASSSVEPIHTAVRGRLRARVAGLYRSEPVKRRLESTLAASAGVRSVSASTVTGTVLILHDPAWSADHALALLIRGLNGGGMAQEASPSPAPAPGNLPWHALEPKQAATTLDSPLDSGLSREAAREALAQHGPNRITEAPRRSGLEIFLSQFQSLPVALLGASAAVSLATGGAADAVIIAGVVLINAVIGYVTETRAEATIESLTQHVSRQARVVRDGRVVQVDVETVVPGDLMVLTPGTHVPADGRIVDASHLFTDESTLTGESLPVQKSVASILADRVPLADRHNMVYMGTAVTGGSGRALVVATGHGTEIGRIQTLIGTAEAPDTPLQKQLERLGNQLVMLSLPVCGLVFALGLVHGYGWLAMLKSAVSLAVAAIPEGLPMVATTTLALGLVEMRRRKILIRALNAVESLGSVQVICLDKTGTLTENRMSVVALCAGDRRFVRRSGEGFGLNVTADLARLAEIAVLCNDSEVDGEKETFQALGTPTENALFEMAVSIGADVPALRAAWPRRHTEYRAENRNFMVTLHATGGRHLKAVKGSPHEVLELCRWRQRSGQVEPLLEDGRRAISAENDWMASRGLRVLGFAYGEDAGAETRDLVWVGMTGMADPLRDGVRHSIRNFHRAGIDTKMITGDQSATAYAIGSELGLSNGAPLNNLDSTHLEQVDPELLSALADRTQVFSRVSPAQKLRIVQALQRAGKVVAMTGDGINDGPALKTADVGIAMGVAGTDIARRVADVVLEEDRLETMVIAIAQGRTIYANIRKSVHFLLATNLSEILLMLGAVGLGLGQPLSPMQLLWINLLTDVFPGLALAMEAPEPDVLDCPPRDPGEPIISPRDFKRIAFESATLTAGAVGAYAWGLARYGRGPRAGGLAFLTLTAAQLAHALSCRSERHSLLRGSSLPPNPPLKLALGASFALQGLALAIPGLRSYLGIAPPGVLDLAVIGAGAALPLLVNEATKAIPHAPHEPRTSP